MTSSTGHGFGLRWAKSRKSQAQSVGRAIRLAWVKPGATPRWARSHRSGSGASRPRGGELIAEAARPCQTSATGLANGAIVTPASASIADAAAAIATAPGLSPCTQIDSRLEAHVRAVDRRDHAFGRQPQHALRPPPAGSCSTAPGLAARDQRAVGRVGTVGEGLGDDAQAGRPARARASAPPASPSSDQARHRRLDGRDHARGLPLVVGDRVVQRAVRLDVAHRRAGRGREALQRTDLVDHVGGAARPAPRPCAGGRSRRGRGSRDVRADHDPAAAAASRSVAQDPSAARRRGSRRRRWRELTMASIASSSPIVQAPYALAEIAG